MNLHGSRRDQDEGLEEGHGNRWIRIALALLLAAGVAAGLVFSGIPGTAPVRESVQKLLDRFRPEETAPAAGAAEEPAAAPQKPFRILVKKPPVPVIFQGTGSGPRGEQLAIISGETVASGAEVHGVKVLEISRQEVLLEFDGRTYRLRSGDRLDP